MCGAAHSRFVSAHRFSLPPQFQGPSVVGAVIVGFAEEASLGLAHKEFCPDFEVMAAYELIDDRKAVYRECRALSLIADNAWNAGVVLGAATAPPPGSRLDGLAARVRIQ